MIGIHDFNFTTLVQGLEELEIRSTLILHKGSPVLEHYREPEVAAQLNRINSCTKSILSALVSIAIDRGILPHQDTPVTRFFPSLLLDSDHRKHEITLAHLLTMTAGFGWTEFGGRNSFPTMTKTDDWVQYVLSLPLEDEPGTRMEYNSGGSQLLSAILRQAAGQTVAEFAEQHLFGPLGIQEYRWDIDPQGNHTGGFGLYMQPKDMAKFGQLFLQKGRWEGQQIISPSTVHVATQPLYEATLPRKGFYGWHWWVSSFPNAEEDLGETSYYYALGYGGQYIVVVPSFELVVVVTNDKYGRKRKPVDVFRQLVVPLLNGEQL
ncbi:serine hydrolase domain-containing protein [Paenibacillus agri]|uniref:Serine hydrolase n=1 Tax=Paenibacillus agri TaxID=2744309 RepID=A0A850EJ14_9BACL|nr:serine hydrolase [Paenibacillus agri]NUU60366.1 serine hydrolase [Paenibacillus agri]